MSGATTPGMLAFELRILSMMRGNEAIVEQALRELGAGQDDMARCRQETGQVFAPTGHFENAVALLGPPMSSESVGDDPEPLTKLTYRLPLWPDLVFYLLGAPYSPIPHDFGFARAPEVPTVVLKSTHDLQPWTCLRDEVIECFGPPIQEGESWAPEEEYKFQGCGRDGRSRQFWTVFSFNLLQHVEWQ